MRLGLGLGLMRQSAPSAPAEMVTNGTFAVDANWTKTLGATISGGTLNASTATAYGKFATQVLGTAVVGGGVYTLVYTISGLTSGGVIPTLDTFQTTQFTARSANGTYTETMTAVAGSAANISFNAGSTGFTGSIDNVSLKRIS